PSTRGGLRLSTRTREQVTESERSAIGSRRVMKTVCMPGRRLIWATWPSTHTVPRRSMYCASALATARTGAGDSAVASRREDMAQTLLRSADTSCARHPRRLLPIDAVGALSQQDSDICDTSLL